MYLPWQNTFTDHEQKPSKNYQDTSTKEETAGSKYGKESEEYYYTGEASPHSKKQYSTKHTISVKTGK